MRFGIFMAPFHPVGQNPTLALERDLELIQHLDALGFHEAWVGEHHSAGYEIIASPEVFIAVAAERTKHIKLGTGVSSLPYHHPLMLADRMVLLDHLTRGRTMLGVGPGQLTSDAHMLGIPADRQRPRMEETLDAMMALLRGETVTMETEGFVLRDARLQLRPYSDPCFDITVAASFSPTGARAAGKHGVGLLSIAATVKQGMDLLGHHWNMWEEIALEHGHVADRSKWRLVGPMHLAETREQAEKDVEYGIAQFSRYFTHILPAGPVQGDTPREIIENNKQSGFAVIGTPEDAIAKLDELVESSGGFGSFLFFGNDWATPAATKRSYELFAQYVMPRYTGQLDPPAASCDWVTGSGGEFVNQAAHAIGKAIEDHAAERAAKQQPAPS
jgi:limonene 1,2-monooxygenase